MVCTLSLPVVCDGVHPFAARYLSLSLFSMIWSSNLFGVLDMWLGNGFRRRFRSFGFRWSLRHGGGRMLSMHIFRL